MRRTAVLVFLTSFLGTSACTVDTPIGREAWLAAKDELTAPGPGPGQVQTTPGRLPPARVLFDPEGIHHVELAMDPTAWQAYLDGVDRPDGKKKYAWYPASVTWNGKAYGEVGVRGFGNGSQITNPTKVNIRIKWDAWTPGKEGPGKQHQIRLKASGQDRTFLREPLAYELVRAVGGFAPRYGWARVWLNGEEQGFYQLFEHTDKRMFKTFFGDTIGNKYEPRKGCMGFNCPPGGCAELADYYEGDPGDGTEIAAFAEAVASSADDAFLPELEARTHVQALMALYAVDATISNLDGLASAGQNFRIYTDATTQRIGVIASGQDLTFGAWDASYDLMAPWGKPNSWCKDRPDHLYERLWQVAASRELLEASFKALQCGPFQGDVLVPRIQSMRDAMRLEVLDDPKAVHDAKAVDDAYAALIKWVKKRQATLADAFGPCS